MLWRIDYADANGAGDLDPTDYPTADAAKHEATTRLLACDMPWAVTARVFPIDDDGEPLGEAGEVLHIANLSPTS